MVLSYKQSALPRKPPAYLAVFFGLKLDYLAEVQQMWNILAATAKPTKENIEGQPKTDREF